MPFKPGQRIRIIRACSGTNVGEEYQVDNDGELRDDNGGAAGCTCNDEAYWELASKISPSMRPLKVGDRIKNISKQVGDNQGKFGEVVMVNSSNPPRYLIRYEDGCTGSSDDLDITSVYKKVTKKSMASKLGTMMKKFLDADTQILVKAGFINGDLELTSEGQEELLAIAFDTHKAGLVAAARAKLEEEEKAK